MKLKTYRKFASITKRYTVVSNDQSWVTLKKKAGNRYKLIGRISKTQLGRMELPYTKDGWQINIYQLVLMYIFSKTKLSNRE